MDQRELKEIEQRTARNWNADGLPELLLGMIWTAWGGLWLIGSALPRGTAYTCFWLVLPPVVACSGFFVNRGLRRLKERVSYPRAGYVRLKRPPAWVRALVALAGLLAVSAVVLLGFPGYSESTLSALVVAAISLLLLLVAAHARNGRLLILAVVSLGLGVWVWRTGAGWMGVNWAFLWLGAAALLTGALRLRRFLRENPKVAEAEA